MISSTTALAPTPARRFTWIYKVDGTNGDGTIYFNILPPGSRGEAIYVGSRDGNSATVRLPQSGEYVIRVT